MYDAGMYDPTEEEDEVCISYKVAVVKLWHLTFGYETCIANGWLAFLIQGFCDFMQEMLSLMAKVREEVILLPSATFIRLTP